MRFFSLFSYPVLAPAFTGFGGFGAAAAPSLGSSSMFSMPTQGALGGGLQPQPFQQPLQQVPGMQQKMEFLRSKKEELEMHLKDERLQNNRDISSSSSAYNASFPIPRSVPLYQNISRSTTKIVPRGLITSATMTNVQHRPLSSVLSLSSMGSGPTDMMSPEKLLGRSSKRLIIMPQVNDSVDPTLDLPLPSYQQKQQQQSGGARFLESNTNYNSSSGMKQSVRFSELEYGDNRHSVTPPRALIFNTDNNNNNSNLNDSNRPLSLTNGSRNDISGLTPITNRSMSINTPVTPHTNGSMTSTPGLSHDDHNGSSGDDMTPQSLDRPQKPTALRISTPYITKDIERESLGRNGSHISHTSPRTSSPYSSQHGSHNGSLSFEPSNPPTLLRPGYLTTPTMTAIKKMNGKELTYVRNFSIYRFNIGNIEWQGETDIRGLDLDMIVNIEKGGVEVYDNEDSQLIKPPMGFGLNKEAIITLEKIFPPENSSELKKQQFVDKLKKICEKSGSEFIDYDRRAGQWIFKVSHFSRYGLDDSDDDDDMIHVVSTGTTPLGGKPGSVSGSVLGGAPGSGSLKIRKEPIVLKPTGSSRSGGRVAVVGGEGEGDENVNTMNENNDNNNTSNSYENKSLNRNESDLRHTSNAFTTSEPSDIKRMRVSFSKSFSG